MAGRSKAWAGVLRSTILFTPFLVITLGAFAFIISELVTEGAGAGRIVGLILVGSVVVLLTYQVVQSIRDLVAETVETIGEVERMALARLPSYDETLRQELGLARTEGEGATLAERLLLPSLTVKGLSSGNVGPRARNIIPASATAALGIRLVKGNNPQAMLDLVEEHIRKQGYHIVRDEPDHATRLKYPKIARVRRGGGYPASRTPMDLPVAQRVVAAMADAAGEAPVVVPALGGSLPLYLFTDRLGKPALIVPIANHDDNQHAPDENLRLANLWYGIDLYAALLTMP